MIFNRNLNKMHFDCIAGVVFPYSPYDGRYSLNFDDAAKACASQDAEIASFDQLLGAWKDGLNWCNAGWLNDGTVQYPITQPRKHCGGANNKPGVRSYGRRNKLMSRFDVFCYASKLQGRFFFSFILFSIYRIRLRFQFFYRAKLIILKACGY